jgi:hypothetical protein
LPIVIDAVFAESKDAGIDHAAPVFIETDNCGDDRALWKRGRDSTARPDLPAIGPDLHTHV